MHTQWKQLLSNLSGNTVWEASARNVARFVLSLPDDATDDTIEAVRLNVANQAKADTSTLRDADNWRCLKAAMTASSNRVQPGRLDMVDDSDLLDIAARALGDYFRMAEELRSTKQKLSATVEAAAIGEAVRAVLNGEPVDDFMESFPEIRHARETYEYAMRYRDLQD